MLGFDLSKSPFLDRLALSVISIEQWVDQAISLA